MKRRQYEHSAYYYAYHYGWTYSEARTYAGRYLDIHTYRPRMRTGPNGEWSYKEWRRWQNAPKEVDSTFNPLLLAAFAAIDLADYVRNQVQILADPVERDRIKREAVCEWRRIRRPFYYAREVERRRALAVERRKIRRRRTSAPMPTPEALRAAWNERKSSREAMILLGGMMHDLECYVDNFLKFNEWGDVVGRNGGIRGWIADNVPELLPKYKTLMRYKALAVRLRQATETKDPKPTSRLLVKPLHNVVKTILAEKEPVFAHVFTSLEYMLSPQKVFLEAPKRRERRRRWAKA